MSASSLAARNKYGAAEAYVLCDAAPNDLSFPETPIAFDSLLLRVITSHSAVHMRRRQRRVSSLERAARPSA